MSIIYPKCQICGEEIYEEHCFVMDDLQQWNHCICRPCMDREKRFLRKVDLGTYEFILGKLDECYTWTPTEEEELRDPDRFHDNWELYDGSK